MVGEIMATVMDGEAFGNTLVFFTSDNGAPQRPDGNSPLRGYKGSVWEGGHRRARRHVSLFVFTKVP